MNREALGARGRVVRVRLYGVTELGLEVTAELRERWVLQLERLEDDRRAALELGRDPLDPRRARERLRRPRNVLCIVGEDDLLALLDDAKRRPAEAAVGHAALDLCTRQQVEEAPLLVTRDEEGLRLPVLVEEPLSLDGLYAAR
jgi:hypothetical protein